MIDPRVQQLHHQRDAELLGEGQDALQPDRAVYQALLIVHAIAVAGKADQLLCADLRAVLQFPLINLHQRIVVFQAVEGFLDHADLHAVLGDGGGKGHHRAV